MQLAGRLVVVTGASSGIGAAAAKAVAGKGATTVLLARTRAKLEEVAREISAAGGQAHIYVVDCGDRKAVAQVAEEVQRELGVPDVIVNNAGAGLLRFFDETDVDEFEKQLAAPFFAAVYVTHAFVKGMIERGSGYIVSVNGPIAWVLWPGTGGYAMARWALRGFSEALRVDLRGTGVRVGQLVPSTVASGYFDHNPGTTERLPGVQKFMKVQTPEDVAKKLVRAIERERRILYMPFPLRQLMSLNRLWPRLVDTITVRSGPARPD